MKAAIAIALILVVGVCHADEESCRAARGREHHAGSNWHVLVTAKSGKVSILGPLTWKRAEWVRATLLGEPATKEECDAVDEAQKKADAWDAAFMSKLATDLKGVVTKKCDGGNSGEMTEVDGVVAWACKEKDGTVQVLSYGTGMNPYEGAYTGSDRKVSSAVIFQ